MMQRKSFGEILPNEILNLETSLSFFRFFFDSTVMKKIVTESNLYATQKDPNKAANFSVTDINRYLGICLYMSIIHMPSSRSYWSKTIGYPQIKSVMSEKKFEFILKNLHFNDNSQAPAADDPKKDRLYKLRPIVDHLNNKYQSIPLEKDLAVDEQLCASKARHHLKQYMPAKPHKWGYKLFILSGVSGFSYHFEIYTGTENEKQSRIIPTGQNFTVYFDNYYTSLPLMRYLANKGIHCLGTVRRNRIPNCKLPTEDYEKSRSWFLV